MTHAFVGASLSVALPERLRGIPAAAGCAFFAAFPDIDIVGFFLGVPYSNTFGHRGITHGLPFAVLTALAVAALAFTSRRVTPKQGLWLSLALSLIIGSHGLLDMATNGGLGVGLFIPFCPDRVFLPIRPIQVSPISPSRFLTDGFSVVLTEILWVWIPSIAVVILVRWWRDRRSSKPSALMQQPPKLKS